MPDRIPDQPAPEDPAPLVTLLCGPAGAGKTTLATSLAAAGALRLSMDVEMHRRGFTGAIGPQDLIDRVHRALQQQFADAVSAGRDVVVDLSLATKAIRQEWTGLARRCGARVELVVLTAPLEVLWSRIEARQQLTGADAVVLDRATLDEYVAGFEWPGPDEPHRVIDTG